MRSTAAFFRKVLVQKPGGVYNQLCLPRWYPVESCMLLYLGVSSRENMQLKA